MKLKSKRSTVTAYASDASIYGIKPHQIQQVESVEEIIAAVAEARRKGLSITARGGGTGLAGGAVGDGIILDFGKFKDIEGIDPASNFVTTQVGIIYEELNFALKPYGLFFPPDPSSGDSCQIGGMLANNSSGPKSVKYGLTSDFVEELEIVTAEGKDVRLKKYPVDSDDLRSFFAGNPQFEKAYNILRENAVLIRERWPKLKKNSSGYNLKQVVDDLGRGIFNIPALFVGSEGTLGLFVRARLRLLSIPDKLLTIRLYFKSPVEAGRAVMPIKKLGPAGLEIVDGSTLDLLGRDQHGLPKEAGALLLVEFDDDIAAKMQAFEKIAGSLNMITPPEYADDPEKTASLWKARRAIVPTLYRHHATRRPVAIIEDVSLPPEEIPSFIEYVTALFKKHRLTFGIYGHIGDGNLHLRPLLDLNDAGDMALAQKLYGEVYEKVINLGGSTTAEHADGRLRAPMVQQLYGSQIYNVFTQLKAVFDSDGVLAPHNIIGRKAFTDDIDFEKIKSYCAACGKCNGYCPAYDIFRREDMSARGWLRMINQSGADRAELMQSLSYCLNCKSCATVCPAGVDISAEIIKFKSEAPSVLSKVIIAGVDNQPLFNFALAVGRLLRPVVGSEAGRKLATIPARPLFGWDRTIELPQIASGTLREKFSGRIGASGEVAFFHGCADNWLESNVGKALFKVFDRLRINVGMPEQKCCGLPMEVYGHRDNLVAKAKYNIDRLEDFSAVVTGCASCLLRLKEYAGLLRDDGVYGPKAARLAEKCYDISQYLNLKKIDTGMFGSKKIRVTYHHPCHLRAAGLHKEPERLLGRFENIEIIAPPHANRCCGQAGSYGYLHYQESRRIFEKKKAAYDAIEAEYLMTSCPSCQMKIRSELKGRFRVVHPIEILADLI